ncbi:hypothetical protein C7437_1011468 [Psychrobacillus insolitus]|uniref:Uncharacterized protein n=1 Tax=Psychrobacillus insolitus TaxID=1461 RepID=A0A2W7MT12_9BACI|nr:hypothetical protein C7437_1011468 [Psychrobacillus insolitus]
MNVSIIVKFDVEVWNDVYVLRKLYFLDEIICSGFTVVSSFGDIDFIDDIIVFFMGYWQAMLETNQIIIGFGNFSIDLYKYSPFARCVDKIITNRMILSNCFLNILCFCEICVELDAVCVELLDVYVELNAFQSNSCVCVELVCFYVELTLFVWNSLVFMWNLMHFSRTHAFV